MTEPIAFHALCEGLAALELRGLLPVGEEDRIWRHALTVLLNGLYHPTPKISPASA